jgi:hypothetical protein
MSDHLESYELNHKAAWEHLKSIATRMGKSYETVRKQCHPPIVNNFGHEEIDRYGAFLQFWYAVKAVNSEGGSLYVQDLIAREAAEDYSGELTKADWLDEIASTAKETSEAIVAACRRESVAEIVVEATQAIAQLQRLISVAHAQADKPDNIKSLRSA